MCAILRGTRKKLPPGNRINEYCKKYNFPKEKKCVFCFEKFNETRLHSDS